MEQLASRTPEWHQWRKAGIGSSDAAVLMGYEKYKTLKELFEEKIGTKENKKEINSLMQHGIDMEPSARAKAEQWLGMELGEAMLIHPEHSFIRASLDGWNKDRSTAIEIKCPTKATHQKILDGEIPIQYLWQMYWQKLVSNCDKMYFCSLYQDSFHIEQINFREHWLKDMEGRAKCFWRMVEEYPKYNRIPHFPDDIFFECPHFYEERMARCNSCGKEELSNPLLAFWQYRPEWPTDVCYDGCCGWD